LNVIETKSQVHKDF